MKYIVVVYILLICYACNKEAYKKVDANELAKTKLSALDLSEVDRYPLFETCDETLSKASQKYCYEQGLHTWIKPYLDTLSFKQADVDHIILFLSPI